MSETIWQRNDDWVGAENEDSFIMVNVDTGNYVALNHTAYAVWQALEVPATESEMVSKLIERFDVSPAECKAALLRLSQKMQDLKLVVTRAI
ncbi:MAG: PqqD family protein [Xanthobacteraceae bacterium]